MRTLSTSIRHLQQTSPITCGYSFEHLTAVFNLSTLSSARTVVQPGLRWETSCGRFQPFHNIYRVYCHSFGALVKNIQQTFQLFDFMRDHSYFNSFQALMGLLCRASRERRPYNGMVDYVEISEIRSYFRRGSRPLMERLKVPPISKRVDQTR